MGTAGAGSFNPFTDRLSRDLRNDLSKGLLAALAGGSPTPLMTVAATYRQRPDLTPDAGAYLSERLACYQVILAAANPDAPEQLALQVWNHELFFEFHELLEQRWLVATGTEKEVLQALIRAAGSYIHRQSGNTAGAEKMAARAQETIKKYRDQLPSGFAAEPLLAGLTDPNAPPPRFGAGTPTDRQCRHTIAKGGEVAKPKPGPSLDRTALSLSKGSR